jgi:Predicted nucleic acid-binding protein, contains PIN domain
VADLLVDTDIFIDHLRGSAKLAVAGDRVHYSTVTRSELFAGHGAEERRITRLLEPFTELPVDRAVAERAGRLRRESGIRAADALIAATALERGLELATRNRRGFEAVTGLQLHG